MTKLPDKVNPDATYLVSGATLNALIDAIASRSVIAGEGLNAKTEPQGIVLSLAASGGGELKQLNVCHNGFSAFRDFYAGDPYVLNASGERVYF
ncbi:MAG: hypothetical protein EBR82_28475 [Caulobacteraceae bacterium]|nr:hypothetical protein [Caulobacteraceae bacterium]